MNQAAKLPEVSKIAVAVASLFATDEVRFASVAGDRAHALAKLFHENPQEAVEAALDSKALAACLFAMPHAKCVSWLAEKGEAATDDDKQAARTMASRYQYTSDARQAYVAWSRHPQVFADFVNSADTWTERMLALRAGIKAERENGQIVAQAAILREASIEQQAMLKAQGKDVDAIDEGQSIILAEKLAANVKAKREAAKTTPSATVDAILALCGKNKVNVKHVIGLLIDEVYGKGKDIFDTAEFYALLKAKDEALAMLDKMQQEAPKAKKAA